MDGKLCKRHTLLLGREPHKTMPLYKDIDKKYTEKEYLLLCTIMPVERSFLKDRIVEFLSINFIYIKHYKKP
jgi:hypothetical protein